VKPFGSGKDRQLRRKNQTNLHWSDVQLLKLTACAKMNTNKKQRWGL
jgi:hypothetical protein